MLSTVDTPDARIAHEYLDYTTIESAARESGLSRYGVVAGVARGDVRAIRIAGDRVLVHRRDVVRLALARAAQTPTQAHADTRPAA